MGKCAGDKALLEAGVRDGHILQSKRNGMLMYYFPRHAYSRETLFSHKLLGDAQQSGGNMSDLDLIDADWDPEKLIPEGLANAGHGLLAGAFGGPSSSTAPPLALPTCAPAGLCFCVTLCVLCCVYKKWSF